ncbi:MAG: RluA family pseudouridine synthase [Bdellovibrionia bacterium]
MKPPKQPKSITWAWICPTGAPRADRAILEAYLSDQGTCDAEQRPSLTRSQLQRLMEDHQVTANGEDLRPNRKLTSGSRIEIHFPPAAPTELIPEDRPLDLLFEDEHLLVLNKPPGLTVHPCASQMQGTLVHALLHHIVDLSGIGGVLRPGIVHRIDKDTSGALVITKSDEAHVQLSQSFAQHAIERSYWALCYGSPPFSSDAPAFEVSSLINRSPTDRKKMSMNVPTGKKAVSSFKKIKEFGQPKKKPFASWIEARLKTGRTHQVRVHLTGLGHSLLGDPLYGKPTSHHPKWKELPEPIQKLVLALPGQALHARVLGFQHPITHQPLRFEADPPQAFKNLLTALEQYG